MILKGFCIGFNKVDLWLNTEIGWYSYQNEEGITIEGRTDDNDALFHLIKEDFILNINNSLYSDFDENNQFTVVINSNKVLEQKKIEHLKRMDKMIYDTGDESIFEIWWIGGIPDGTVTDSDYAECLIEYDEICDLFDRIML
jgi:hypothetical protein